MRDTVARRLLREVIAAAAGEPALAQALLLLSDTGLLEAVRRG